MTTDVADVDFQHTFEAFARNHVVWGLGYRYTRTEFDDNLFVRVDPTATARTSLFSAFVQDEIALIKDELRLTIGSKFEHNDSTGVEIQPSARILWSPTPTQSVWAAVSRAVRLPSIGEEDAELTAAVIPPFTPKTRRPFPPRSPSSAILTSSPRTLLAFEVGYRAQPFDKLSFDITAFYNVYDNLRASSPATPFFVLGPGSAGRRSGPDRRRRQRRDLGFRGRRRLGGVLLVAAEGGLHLPPRRPGGHGLRPHGTSPLHQASLRSMIDLGPWLGVRPLAALRRQPHRRQHRQLRRPRRPPRLAADPQPSSSRWSGRTCSTAGVRSSSRAVAAHAHRQPPSTALTLRSNAPPTAR